MDGSITLLLCDTLRQVSAPKYDLLANLLLWHTYFRNVGIALCGVVWCGIVRAKKKRLEKKEDSANLNNLICLATGLLLALLLFRLNFAGFITIGKYIKLSSQQVNMCAARTFLEHSMRCE